MNLDEKSVVVITGAGNGIGEGLARCFASQGCTVVIADIDLSAARSAASRLTASGALAFPAQVDVGDIASVAALSDMVYNRFARVDLLCCNAGVSMRPFRASWSASVEDYEWLTRINYLGFIHTILSFVPRMREQSGERRVLVTSSVTALAVSPGHAPYAATNAAVTAVADALRDELAETTPGFGVTVVYPGLIPTKITASERLRPEIERSSGRTIEEFQSTRPTPTYDFPVDVDVASARILEALRRNADSCLTHPYPEDAIEARVGALRAGDLSTF